MESTIYQKAKYDFSARKPLLKLEFIEKNNALNAPNLIIQKSADDKLKVIHSENVINIYTQEKSAFKLARQIVESIINSDKDTLYCYFHIDLDLSRVAYECLAGYYDFDLYKSNKYLKEKTIYILADDVEQYKSQVNEINIRAQAAHIMRDLSNMPSNYLLPSDIERISNDLQMYGIKTKTIEGNVVKDHMGGLYNVGKAGVDSPRLVILEWKPKNNETPIALVGKGITFDTGGVCVKPAHAMLGMHQDMTGAAAVLSTLYASARLNVQQNIVGLLACAENAISGQAFKPNDVIYTYPRTIKKKQHSKTVEIRHTDAEGRLVLADALCYVQEHYKPSAIVDIATLTGAVQVALGSERCGVFANNDALFELINISAQLTGEKIWRLPLDKEYNRYNRSKVADIANSSVVSGACPGSVLAAKFLEFFVDNNMPWAHFDIAGIIDTYPSFGVNLLLDMCVNFYKYSDKMDKKFVNEYNNFDTLHTIQPE